MLCFIFSPLVVLKHQLYTITSPHTAKGQTFSTFSWPGNCLKIHMRNFLTSSQKLICSRNDFVALYSLYKNQKAFYYISVCVPQFESAEILPFQNSSSADVSMPYIFREDAKQWDVQGMWVDVYQRNTFI